MSDGRRILVADDDDASLELMEMLLAEAGHIVTTATDGPSALAAVRAHAPDIVLLDLGLPGMDGHEVARRLHAAHGESSPRLYALTGYDDDESRRRRLSSPLREGDERRRSEGAPRGARGLTRGLRLRPKWPQTLNDASCRSSAASESIRP